VVSEKKFEELPAMLKRSFDIVSYIRSSDIPELFVYYIGAFLFDDEMQFLK
jgi:hypothetical protein